jgi:hypothetical protein
MVVVVRQSVRVREDIARAAEAKVGHHALVQLHTRVNAQSTQGIRCARVPRSKRPRRRPVRSASRIST